MKYNQNATMLIYSQSITPRLEYILSFILTETLGIYFNITTDKVHFENAEEHTINYSPEDISSSIQIIPHSLLFEKHIEQKKISCFINQQYPAFFKNEKGYPFDLLAASFYLISRYEEYLPYEEDSYGRYPHLDSLAFREKFLHLPLVNIWINDFAKFLQEKFPALVIQLPVFKFIPTYDIDIAWSYKHKGLLRNVGGFIKHPSMARWNVLANKAEDPFNVYAGLHELHATLQTHPIYFFLVAQHPGKFDKNISPHQPAMQQLIREHANYTIGLHPSWKSFEDVQCIQEEKNLLENIIGKNITSSRQHYIKMRLPQTYQRLIAAGISDDYSMGYGSINGFRASVSTAFYWYDLSKEKRTGLRIHPFCFMDANSFYEQQQTAAESLEELMRYYLWCRYTHSTLITIFHNHFLGTDPLYKDWKELYYTFTSRFQQSL